MDTGEDYMDKDNPNKLISIIEIIVIILTRVAWKSCLAQKWNNRAWFETKHLTYKVYCAVYKQTAQYWCFIVLF